MKEHKRAWVYCRINAPEDTNGNIKSQKKDLYDYAEQMGFLINGFPENILNRANDFRHHPPVDFNVDFHLTEHSPDEEGGEQDSTRRENHPDRRFSTRAIEQYISY